MLKLKRAYDPPSKRDGLRVLVERLWPRGLSKEEAAVDWWLKDVAPSTELRRWFGHAPDKWPEFRRRYREELTEHADAVAELRRAADRGAVTLLYAARDTEHNSAIVLREALETGLHRHRKTARPQPRQ